MAKGNLLLGTAGNSVGDVVMYRREGAQVSRVRVRKVKNPKTAAQSTQRAFFAPVAKFYSPLSIVLERSYEGLSKSKSYSKFLKTNVDLARLNNWLLPKGTGFFPLPYKLSSGSLPSVGVTDGLNNLQIHYGSEFLIAQMATIGDLSSFFITLGYKPGDIVSIIWISGTIANGFTAQSYQFEVNAASTDTIANVLKGLTIEGQAGPGEYNLNITGSGTFAGGSVIVARYENEKWRRSSEYLVVATSITTAISTADYKAAAIASYGATNTGDNPLVYLDGKELE